MWTTTVLNLGILVLSASACYHEIDENKQNIHWWKTSVIYQIYPRSFKDSNDDGIGDLNGITEKLEHLKDAGIDALWLSPIYSSPQKDFGYDISDFTNIHKEYGTLEDFDRLVDKAKQLGLKVLLDFVPNHSSDEHEWFKKSIKGEEPYKDFYIWKDGKKAANGTVIGPPNNWLSAFGGSAWEWNEKRKQYYYHAFDAGQPDLNYRNPILDQEMKNVLLFWMKRRVDGFRIDAVNYLFEDPQLRDEPKSGLEVPESDYDYLNHIYTRDLNDTYGIVTSWQKLTDYFVRNWQTDGKVLILEAYTSLSNSMKFYDVGANPFNFMFISPLNNESTALQFKSEIDTWIGAIPDNKPANWVVGNHDNHRVATRYGEKRADQISMLAVMLPGITVVYNGDEIGMVDRPFTFEETVDPAGCKAGRERYELKSRDPERTPYQWDDTTSAGFSNNAKTWLPVHENYKQLNLAAQKKADVSHYKVFQALTMLKKTESLLKGNVRIQIANENENVLAVVRELRTGNLVILLINFNNDGEEIIDAKTYLNTPDELEIYIGSVESGFKVGTKVKANAITLPAAASVILK